MTSSVFRDTSTKRCSVSVRLCAPATSAPPHLLARRRLPRPARPGRTAVRRRVEQRAGRHAERVRDLREGVDGEVPAGLKPLRVLRGAAELPGKVILGHPGLLTQLGDPAPYVGHISVGILLAWHVAKVAIRAGE